jgi:hypothetical protein
MEKDARTVGHLNKASGLEYKGQIKFAPTEKLDRANFKWADVSSPQYLILAMSISFLLWYSCGGSLARLQP